jgi:hypothetical protein
MTDVTAQAFREAAENARTVPKLRTLLLAAAEQREQVELLHDILHSIAVDAMTAQSDPHASASDYRKALVILCNRALSRGPNEAKR